MSRNSNRPVICQVLHSLHIGGAEVLADGLARSLSNRFRFVFVCLDEIGSLGERLMAYGFPVGMVNRKTPGIDWKCGFRLAAKLREQKVDVIHAHQYTPFFQSLVSRLSYRRPPIVFTEHGRHFPDSRSAKRVAVNRLLLRKNDRCFGVGESVRQALIKNEGLSPDRVEVIYNGVDLDPFAAVRDDNAQRAEMRAELGLNATDFVVLQVARLNPLKDHLTAVRAIERLADSGQFGAGKRRVHLLLAGEGDQRGLIEQVLRDRSLGSHVTLLGSRRDVPQLLAASDAFLLSSISEGIPLTLIEAMAAGVPVVSTDVGGIGEVITDGETGLLAATGDDARLAAHLASLTDVSLQTHLCAQAARVAEKRFSLKTMHSKYARVYRQLAGTRTSTEAPKAKRRAVQKSH
ncbi:MAG: glycosyltransferase [Planctomycetes bacterium]|nr:glycosyltransferase [Planctomycetota bacterium]